MGTARIATAEPPPPGAPFGAYLRHWRQRRRYSQLDLALEAEVSTRHLSCLETGKAKPSREMILVLGSALEVPLRQRNLMLQAAGFTPAYRESRINGRAIRQVRRAIDFMLKRLSPCPAFLVDHHYNILQFNAGASRLTAWSLGLPPDTDVGAVLAGAGGELNMLRLTLATVGLRQSMVNWEQVARVTLDRFQREAALSQDAEAHALLEELLAQPDLPEGLGSPDLERAPESVLPVILERDGLRLSFFSTITTVGTPLDVTLQGLRVETMFPNDEVTEAWMEAS